MLNRIGLNTVTAALNKATAMLEDSVYNAIRKAGVGVNESWWLTQAIMLLF
ncbi:MAG: hypothetical protein ACRCUP_06080 [Mycoplasmatales bacterium]